MLAHAAEAQRVRQEPALRRGLGERPERRPMVIRHAEWLRVRDDRGTRIDDAVDAREAEPVAAAQPDRAELVCAALRGPEREG
jgi:hypothetical protein